MGLEGGSLVSISKDVRQPVNLYPVDKWVETEMVL